MEETIKKLIAVDKAAREKVEKAEQMRDSLSARMAVLKQETVNKAKKDFSEQLAQKQNEIRQELQKEFSKQELENEEQRVIGEMDRLFSENKACWVQEIFSKAIG